VRLSKYHLDGRYLLDNNGECHLPLAVGRKAYMFCSNHNAAENAAVIYSLLVAGVHFYARREK